MERAEVFLSRAESAAWCRIVMEAEEIPAFKIECSFAAGAAAIATDGAPFTDGQVRLLCLSGIRFARSKLRLAAGLQVIIHAVKGELTRADELGVCNAAAVALVKSLGEPIELLLMDLGDWIAEA